MARALILFAWLSAVIWAQSPASPPPDAGSIDTDRPDVTDSAFTVPVATLQFENGVTWHNDHGQRTFDATETQVRLGIADKWELRAALPLYSHTISGSAPVGFSDFSLGMKHQLGPLAGEFELSVIASLSFPAGAHNFTSGGYEPSVQFPWARDMGHKWEIGGMQSLFWNTGNGRRNGLWEPAFFLQRNFMDNFDAFAEYVGDFHQRGGNSQIAHFGAVYKVTRNNQIDMHFGFGLNSAAPDHFFALGYSFRFERLWAHKP